MFWQTFILLESELLVVYNNIRSLRSSLWDWRDSCYWKFLWWRNTKVVEISFQFTAILVCHKKSVEGWASSDFQLLQWMLSLLIVNIVHKPFLFKVWELLQALFWIQSKRVLFFCLLFFFFFYVLTVFLLWKILGQPLIREQQLKLPKIEME